MALRTNKKTAVVHVDPLSFNIGIKVLSGNTAQVFNRETQEYISDRTLVPLIMIPEVHVIDPHGVQNGVQELTSVEWYEGTPKANGTNRIVAGTDYEIGDGKVTGFPKYALKCKKNVDPNIPIEIFAIAVFTDKRRNTEVRLERNIKVYTAYYDALNYSVKIDKPSGWTIDPLQVVPDAEGSWKHTITAQLYSGKTEVQDSHAAYWWEIFENGAWRQINDDDIALWIDCKDASGNFTKTLTFDARLIDRKVSFRARASYYEAVKPVSPTSEELQATTAVLVELPKTLNVEQIQTKGARVDIELSTPVAHEVVISYNKGIIGIDKDYLFSIEWYGRSLKPGSVEKLLGKGRSIEFIPSDKGFDPKYPFNVYAVVRVYAGHATITVKSPVVGEADRILVVNGIPVIQPTYI